MCCFLNGDRKPTRYFFLFLVFRARALCAPFECIYIVLSVVIGAVRSLNAIKILIGGASAASIARRVYNVHGVNCTVTALFSVLLSGFV